MLRSTENVVLYFFALCDMELILESTYKKIIPGWQHGVRFSIQVLHTDLLVTLFAQKPCQFQVRQLVRLVTASGLPIKLGELFDRQLNQRATSW